MATIIAHGRSYDFTTDEIDAAYLALTLSGHQNLPKSRFTEDNQYVVDPDRMTISVAGRHFSARLTDVNFLSSKSAFLRILTILDVKMSVNFFNGTSEAEQLAEVLWRLSKRVPEEILEYVLLRVDHKSLMTLCTTDERFAKICDDETFLRKHEKLRTVVTNSKTYANNIETDVERIQYDEKQHIVTRRNGKIVGEEYLIDGKLERLNGPAYISYRQDGTILFEKYYVDGKLYRLSGPVVVVYDKNGKIDKEQYCDKLSQNSSIVITYYYEGTIRSIAYYENDILHRLNGPAFINYDTNGKIYSREYFENGKKHRLNGPAFIFYDENGSIYSEEYYEDDNLHRLNGPAVILYDKNGHIFREEHWERGKRK